MQGHAASATQQTAIIAMVTAHGTLTNVSLKVQKNIYIHILTALSPLSILYLREVPSETPPPVW